MEHSKRIMSFTHEELEDAYYKLYAENTELKKILRTQDLKMKNMATKIIRLASDRKYYNESETDNGLTDRADLNLVSSSKVPQTNFSNCPDELICDRSHGCSSEIIRDLTLKKSALEQALLEIAKYMVVSDKRISELQASMEEKEKSYENQLRQQKLELVSKQRLVLQENIELIRIQRKFQEVKSSLILARTEMDKMSMRLEASELEKRNLSVLLQRTENDLLAKNSEISNLETQSEPKFNVHNTPSMTKKFSSTIELLMEESGKMNPGQESPQSSQYHYLSQPNSEEQISPRSELLTKKEKRINQPRAVNSYKPFENSEACPRSEALLSNMTSEIESVEPGEVSIDAEDNNYPAETDDERDIMTPESVISLESRTTQGSPGITIN